MYLFNNTPIQTRFDESDKKIASELNKITDNELLNCDLQKIADRIEQQYSIICDTEFTTEDVEPISYLMPISREALRPELRIGAIHEFYDFVAVDYKFKIQGDYTFFFNTPTDTHYAPIKGSANANGLTLTIITELEDAIQSAMTNGRNGLGCVVTFSAGNYDSNTVGYPARSLPDIIVVGALSLSGKRKSSTTIDNEGWWGSDYGTQLDIMAPGVLIYTTDRTGSVGYVSGDYMPNFNGTSSACPHVAGVAALILSVNPNLTQKEVATIIEKTARKVGGYSYSTVSGRPNGTWHTEVGYGLIDAYAAVMEAQNASTTVYFNDKTVTTNTVVSGSEISATNVTVKNNAKLTFTNAKSIIITQPFTVELTSSLELSLQ